MQAPNEPLTLANVIYVAGGAGFAAICSWAANWALKRTERRLKRDDDVTAAQIKADAEERNNFRLAQHTLIESLRTRVADSEKDRDNIWNRFREMQVALSETQGKLNDCELLHRADAIRISSQEVEIISLNERIKILELRVNGI